MVGIPKEPSAQSQWIGALHPALVQILTAVGRKAIMGFDLVLLGLLILSAISILFVVCAVEWP